MFLVMALLAAQVAQAENLRPRPKPLSPPHTWINDDDYPKSAAVERRAGLLRYSLEVDPKGFPVKCSILRSSSHEELDREACVLMLQRARFSPARDADGKPITADFSGVVLWNSGAGGSGNVQPTSPDILDLTVAALPADYRGPVRAEIIVGEDPVTTNCRIIETSGSGAADRAAFRQLEAIAADPAAKAARKMASTQTYIVSFRTEAPAKP
ncbi:energy transducer TonB [Sphingomonas sp. ABOLE]|uniref:energy transducer TonB n=1 Tax=Sphingomonas sp. ABOLE TaxID=1985878 RepID=UPI0013DFC7B0|nr:energy transducer TonB [Sphingomonas sp. ABOLE]